MNDLEAFARLVPLDHGLVVVSTARADGTIQSSVVNAGVLDHPLTNRTVVAFVAAGSSRRLINLRARPRTTVVIRAGWQWAGVEGPVELAGPDDLLEGIDGDRLRLLLREISPPPAAPTTTGTSTTASWPTSAVSPCSSSPSTPTATANRNRIRGTNRTAWTSARGGEETAAMRAVRTPEPADLVA